MSSKSLFFLRKFRIAFIVTSVFFATSSAAQVVVPLIPTDIHVPPPGTGVCLSANNPNFDAWDPCCNAAGSNLRPAYCPSPISTPFDLLQPSIASTFAAVMRAIGLETLLGNLGGTTINEAADYLATQAVNAAFDYVLDFLVDDDSTSSGSGALTVFDLSSQLFLAGDRLTSVILSTMAGISEDPNFAVETGTAYRLPFLAGPTVRDTCQETGAHRERSFDLGVMNGVSNNGAYTFTTQAGVPTEIKANRPSWTSRQIWDFRWIWWFGDAVMVPQSAEDDSYTVHTYPFKGDFTLAFTMLKEDIAFWLGFSSGPDGFGWSDVRPGMESTGNMFPDACNYGTMQVVENTAPVAQFTVGPTNIAFQLRFTAAPSFDADGNPLSYLWVLEDGATTRARTFTKMYPVGTSMVVEDVQLTVSDGAKMHTTSRTVSSMPSNCVSAGPLQPIAGGLCGDDDGGSPFPFP